MLCFYFGRHLLEMYAKWLNIVKVISCSEDNCTLGSIVSRSSTVLHPLAWILCLREVPREESHWWLVRSIYPTADREAVFLSCDGDIVAACWPWDRIMRGWVMQEFKSGQLWFTDILIPVNAVRNILKICFNQPRGVSIFVNGWFADSVFQILGLWPILFL